MKHKKAFALILCLGCLPLLTGCPNDNSNGSQSNSGSAPSTLSGRTISVTVSAGTAPFVNNGSYLFTPAGDGTSGTYQLQNTGGAVQSNIGTYTYTKTGNNTASLVETEQSGTVVQNTLTFNSATSGTIHSFNTTGLPAGGTQDGTFTLN